MKTEHEIARCKGGVNYRGYFFRRKGRWWIYKCEDDSEIAVTNIRTVQQLGDWWAETEAAKAKAAR